MDEKLPYATQPLFFPDGTVVEEFIIPDEQVIGYHLPASTYKLSLTNGETTNSVTWHDDTMTKPSYTKADQLRELMNLIEETIQSHPEIKQLPEPKAGCA